MRTDNAVKTVGMKLLFEGLGIVDTERFISLIKKESYDYTTWKRKLFDGMGVYELSNKSKKYVTTLSEP